MDEVHFETSLQQKRRLQEEKSKKYEESSNERLLSISSKKIKTTMIGALQAIEDEFSYLWTPEENEEVDSEHIFMKNLFDKVRERILDLGNVQIRNLEKEFKQYDVFWKRFTINLPVKKD